MEFAFALMINFVCRVITAILGGRAYCDRESLRECRSRVRDAIGSLSRQFSRLWYNRVAYDETVNAWERDRETRLAESHRDENVRSAQPSCRGKLSRGNGTVFGTVDRARAKL